MSEDVPGPDFTGHHLRLAKVYFKASKTRRPVGFGAGMCLFCSWLPGLPATPSQF